MNKTHVFIITILINFTFLTAPGQVVPVCYETLVEESICDGQNFILPDGIETSFAGTYESVLTSVEGCDSIVTTNLSVNNPERIREEATICSTENYTLPDGAVVNEQKVYFSTITNEDGCNQVVETQLNVNISDQVNTWIFICKGETYELPDGRLVGEKGTYETGLTSIYGCDSVITIVLGVNTPTTREEVHICEGGVYTLPDGLEVSTAGVYETIFTTNTGCMEVTETMVTIDDTFEIVKEESICEGSAFLLPDGMEISVEGSYETVLSSTQNCDSIVITNLTISPNVINEETIRLCENASYTLPNGTEVSTAGEYTSIFVDEQGCEVTTETTIILDDVLGITREEIICEGSTFLLPDGREVSTTGVYETVLSSTQNCDSVVIINLTVSPSIFNEETIRLCENASYILPNGMDVSTAGEYTSILENEQGCEVITKTTIILDEVLGTTREENICEGNTFLLPDGSEVSITGVYETVLSSTQNCDSVVIINLTVSPSVFNEETILLCENASYTLPNGTEVSTAGMYTSILENEQGCEAITETTIVLDNVLGITIEESICQGNTFLLPDGSEVSDAGIYETLLSSSQSCDSVVTTNLEVFTLDIDMATEVSAQPEGVILQNDILSINPVNYTWSPVENLSCTDCPNPIANPNETTTYQLTIDDVFSGCSVSAEIKVLLEFENPIAIATAFSPNQDGVNDYLIPQGLNNETTFQFIIYNRYGQKLFQSNSNTVGWDGIFNNLKQPVGVYLWVLSYEQSNGRFAQLNGNVTLLR